MKKFGKIVLIVLLIVVIVGSSGCFVVTEQDEYTIVRQFGKVVGIRDEAGVSFKLPFLQM